MNVRDNEDVIETLNSGGVGVLPTDTIYGLVGSALMPKTVERVYKLKKRSPDKQLIVLIADTEEIEQFGIILSEKLTTTLETYWPRSSSARAETLRGKPGAYSIILPTLDEDFAYLHRGGGTIAFRLPDKDDLCELIRKTGPLVAPSANIEGKSSAQTIEQARKYFGTDVDFYIDGGELAGKPSTVLLFDNEKVRIVR